MSSPSAPTSGHQVLGPVKITSLYGVVDGFARHQVVVIQRKYLAVVGMALLTHPDTDTPVLGDLYVTPGFRRLGLGHQLVRYAKQWAAAHGKMLFLHVRPENGVAMHLYVQQGFKLTGELTDDGSEWMAWQSEEAELAQAEQEGGQADG